MTVWTPEWKIFINGYGDFTNLTLANLSITSGRTDIYSQPTAGYCSLEIINLDETPIQVDVNDQVTIEIKDSTGTYIPIFGGFVSDINVMVIKPGSLTVSESIRLVILGTLSKLPKVLTEGILSKDFDGNQIFAILSDLLLGIWNELPPAEIWSAYNPASTWANAENIGLGQIDTPGNYELTARTTDITDTYSLVASLANSGLGYLYEDAYGRISYADSLHRSNYLSSNGYTLLDANQAIGAGMQTSKRLGEIRNDVTISYKANAIKTAQDVQSIKLFGYQAQNIVTTLENALDAQNQADFYLKIRAFPQAQFKSITFPLTSPEISDVNRDSLLNIFMGLPVDISNLPSNMLNGNFQGFVEGWTFQASYNGLQLNINLSPTSYSIQTSRWDQVSVTETWNTINVGLEWINATIVA